MDLLFQTNTLSCLTCVLEQTLRQEETGEIVVPDSYPDISTILDSAATAILRGKDCRAGSVTISGGMKGQILYLAEGERTPRCLELYLPFSIRAENPGLTEQAQVICVPRIRSVDGQMLNSRKAMLRAEVSCRLLCYEPSAQTIYELTQHPEELQVKTEEYPLFLPLEAAEKAFLLNETMDLPPDCPAAQLYRFQCELELGETRLAGNKGLFKGAAVCKLLYLGEDQRLHLHRQQLPFSQYCEFRTDFDQEEAAYFPVLTGYDLDWDKQTAAGSVSVALHILVQAMASGVRTLTIPTDAFATEGRFQPQWSSYEVEASLDRQKTTQNLRQQLETPMVDVLDWSVYPDVPEYTRGSEQVTQSIGASVHVLGYDKDAGLCAATGRLRGTEKIDMAEKCSCACHGLNAGPLYLSPTPDGLEARLDFTAMTDCFAKQAFRGLSGGNLEEEDPAQKGKRPSIILKRTMASTEIWTLAKAAGAREQSIREANGLEGNEVAAGELLLIPVG